MSTNGETTLVKHEASAMTFAPQNMDQAMKMAESLSRSALMPNALKGKPADILVVLMTGHELGLAPMQSIRGISVIQGKGVMSADLIVGLVKNKSACKYFRLVSSTKEKATYETLRDGSPEPVRLDFTIEQARAAGLTGKDNWKNYPEAMLRARCASALARAEYPDIAMGLYDPDEIPKEEEQSYSSPRKPPVRAEASAPQAEAIEAVSEESVLDKYSREMDAAKTEEELQNIGPRIKKDPDAQQYRKELAAKYSACMNALKGAA